MNGRNSPAMQSEKTYTATINESGIASTTAAPMPAASAAFFEDRSSPRSRSTLWGTPHEAIANAQLGVAPEVAMFTSARASECGWWWRVA